MKKSPLALAKDRFGGDAKEAKAKLVKAVKALTKDDLFLDRVNDGKGLEHASNKKLLHLLDVLTAVKEKGGRKGVVKAILDAEKRVKDEGFKARLERFSSPKLLDVLQAAEKRVKSAN